MPMDLLKSCSSLFSSTPSPAPSVLKPLNLAQKYSNLISNILSLSKALPDDDLPPRIENPPPGSPTPSPGPDDLPLPKPGNPIPTPDNLPGRSPPDIVPPAPPDTVPLPDPDPDVDVPPIILW